MTASANSGRNWANSTDGRKRNKTQAFSYWGFRRQCFRVHYRLQLIQEKTPTEKSRDQDRGKGAMEQDQQNKGGNTNMQGQLGHRDEDEELKDADADLGG